MIVVALTIFHVTASLGAAFGPGAMRFYSRVRMAGTWDMFAGKAPDFVVVVRGTTEAGEVVTMDSSRGPDGLLDRVVDARQRKILSTLAEAKSPWAAQSILRYYCRVGSQAGVVRVTAVGVGDPSRPERELARLDC